MNTYMNMVFVKILKQTTNSHLSGQHCPKCTNNNKTSNTTEFVQNASKKQNNKHTYECVVYENASTKVKTNCTNNNHGIFEQTPHNHLNGNGCPKCVHKNEQLCCEAFELYFYKPFNKCRPFDILYGLEYEGYNEELNIAFEYHGKQHYQPGLYFGG